jgi:chitodextrinase
MKQLLLLSFLFGSLGLAAQTAQPIPHSQDFNTLALTGTSSTLPDGWALLESLTNANTTYTAGTGSSNTGDSYSFGAASATDRALGGVRSGSLAPLFGGLFVNNTGSTISSLTIAYTGEQWRLGTASRTDRLDFQYSTTATSLSTGTWIDVDALDFTTPNTAAAVGSLDGNAAANRTAINYTLSGISIPAGGTIYIRFSDFDASGADDGLSVDDFSITLGCTPPTNQPTALTLTPSVQSLSGSFTAAVAGSTPATDYLVVMSTSPTLGAQPASGEVYAIDDDLGSGVVVSEGTGTTFTVTGLTPATTYYFFVYSFAGGTSCYNITNPLTATTATTTPPACTPPSTQASGLTFSGVTGTSITLNYTRGNGSNILILARAGSAVNASPTNSIAYTSGTQLGSGNYVIYNGPAATFTYSGLTPNTAYYFDLYEYAGATNCYKTPALSGTTTTACTGAVNATSFTANAGNAQVALTWTNPSASCFDEVLVIASNTPITAAGNTFTGSGNPAYGGGTQVIYRGTGNSVLVTGLTNGTTYYFKVFTRNNPNYSTGVQVTASPFDPAAGYMYLYGNLHAHSSYSDGNKDNTSKTPKDDYEFARDANCMDFLGISEHNHSTAGLVISDYRLGYAQANLVNGVVSPTSGNSIVTLWGMEWGVISNGGHVLLYGFDDKLIGWESGNYDIFCAKSDYTALWPIINSQPGAFATLAHPGGSDYSNIGGTTYSLAADNAIAGTAVESGPAFSTSTSYNDYPSSLSYLSYFKKLLAKGYHLGPQMDQDTHNMTFGKSNANRMVVLTTGKTRAALSDGIRAMRFYASQDCNVKVDFKNGTSVMGSSVEKAGVPVLTINVTDVDPNETVGTIELWAAEANGTVPSSAIKTYTSVGTATFGTTDVENTQPNGKTWYYFLVITQGDGNKIVTSPIWYSRNDAITTPTALPSIAAPGSAFNLYPNPATGKTVIYSTRPTSERVTVQVTDATGRVVGQRVGMISKAAPFTLDLAGYTPGTYFVKLIGKTVQVQKVIVQ